MWRRAGIFLIFFLFLFSIALAGDKDRAWKLIEKGRYKEAIKIADQLIKEGDVEGYFIKAKALYSLGEESKALETLLKAKDLDPDNPRIYTDIGRIYAIKAIKLKDEDPKANEYKETAKLYFQKALEVDSSYLPPMINLAQLCFVFNDDKCFQEWVEEAYSLAPDDPRVLKWKAMELQKKGKYSSLRDLLEKHKDLLKGDPELKKLLARAYIETNEPENARKVLNELLKESTDDLEVYYLLGKLYGRRRAIEVERYIQNLGLPEDKLYLALAFFWEGVGDVEMTLSYYAKAIDKNPDDPELYNLLSTYLMSENRFQEAIPYLKKLLELKPDYKSYFLIGMAYRHAGDPHTAIRYLEKAKELNPKYAYTYIQLSNAYFDIAFSYFNEGSYEGFKWYDKGIQVVKEGIENVTDPYYKAKFQKGLKELIRDRDVIKRKIDEARRKMREGVR